MGTEDFYRQCRQRLDTGVWAPGQRLPSIRRALVQFQISHHSVVKTYERLMAEGLIESQRGRGYYVIGSANLPAAAFAAAGPELSCDPLFRLIQADSSAVKLGSGWLPTGWRDTDILARAVRRTARLERSSLVEYGDIQGYRPLRLQLARHLQQKIRLEVPPKQLLTTIGATQALDLVTRLLVKPGDKVLVDEPGNGNLIKLIRLQGGVVLGVPRTPEGPDCAALAHLASQHDIKAFYCNTSYHNPTGASLSGRNAFAVLRLAAEHDFMIIEDDVYGDFAVGAHQSFAELDGLERVIYIGSFSKSLSASLRIGYLACNLELMAELVNMKLLTAVTVPGFCERFVNIILSDGSYQKHMQGIVRKLMVQQKNARQALERLGWRCHSAPDGGMFLWVHHPRCADLSAFIERLACQQVLLMPGSAFSMAAEACAYTRINVAHFTQRQAPLFVL